jgi:cobalt/nickel transport system permease protein
LSWHGVEVALLLAAKAIALLTLFLTAQATAPLEDTLKAAHALRIPGLLVQLGLLSYRYVFVLADELRRLRIALRVRGYRNRVSRHSYRTAGHIAGTLLVRGSERAERVGQAMRCRGFDGQFRSLKAFKTRPADIGAFLLIAASAAALAVWDWLP